LKKKKILAVPIGVVFTDYDAHAIWLYRSIDWYFAAHEETRAYLIAVGIPPETIFVTGIPIDPVFSVGKSKKEMRSYPGLDLEKTIILVSAGGVGVGPVELMVKTLQDIQHHVQIIIV
jgi:processive 1,2-diacylglycerol beta-glucosyltransferase